MTFPTGYLADMNKVGSGEIHGGGHVILSSSSFADGLTIGRFAQLLAGVVSNMNNTATPNVLGVVKRMVSYALEAGSNISAAYNSQIDYVTAGLVTVDAVAETAPARGVKVYAYNGATLADNGKVTATSGGNIDVAATFVQVVSPNVWLVQIK